MKTNNLATFKERLISAWCCLTYKEFFMCACERNENGTTKKAKNYYSTLDTKEYHPFFKAIHKVTDDKGEYSFMKRMNV